MGKGKEKRNVPAIHYLNYEMLRIREKEDLESGGFMLKTRIDLGKRKENLVRDIETIGRMRYVDEAQAETSIKVERVDCNSTKVDNHKDANTFGMRKLEIMPCKSNNEEFASVLTSEFDKILSMFVKIDGVMEKRLKICPGDPFIRNFMVKMDDPNISMEEYIRLEEEKAQRHVFDDAFTSEVTLSCEPTVSPLNENKINFRISFDESYDEDYRSKLDFLTEPNVSPQHIDEFNLKDETSLSECDEEEQNILYSNDLFPFNVIYPNDSKSDKDKDNDKIDIEQPSGVMSVKPLPDLINTDDGAYAHGSNELLETSHDTSNKFFKTETFIKELNLIS
ncbi:hypothetical protein Tco_1029904 [Tanacetum coccineum]|uniref:Uncharacterized protein n=1 Tax=Tanacetum coccineum TaxID=301880 RepID=A0ABQ5G4R2_9ASTR